MVYNKKMNHSRGASGQILFEILIAVSVFAVVLTTVAGLVYAGLRGSSEFLERDRAIYLMEETFEGFSHFTFERWNAGTTQGPTGNPRGIEKDPSIVAGGGGVRRGSSNSYFVHKYADPPNSSILVEQHARIEWGFDTINAISALSPRNVWVAVGNKVWRNDSLSWENIGNLTGPPLRGIVAFSPNTLTSATNVIVVGDSSTVLSWDGSAWSDIRPGSGIDYLGVSKHRESRLYVVGTSGAVYENDGSTWRLQSSASDGWGSTTFRSVAGLSVTYDDDIAWVVGDGGRVYRKKWGGATNAWERVSNICFEGKNLYGVSLAKGSSTNVDDEAWIVGSGGTVCQFKGNLLTASGTWTDHTPSSGERWGIAQINGVSAFSPTKTVIAGNGGHVWIYISSGGSGAWTQINSDGKWGNENVVSVAERFSTMVFIGGANAHLWEIGNARWRICAVGGSDCVQSGTNDNGKIFNQGKINEVTYFPSFFVQNVCRDKTTKTIISAIDGTNCGLDRYLDPNIIKVNARVDWARGSVEESRYVTRWLNALCSQTAWNGGTTTSTVQCGTSRYQTATSDITTSSSDFRLSSTASSGTLTSARIQPTTVNGPAYNAITLKGQTSGASQRIRLSVSAYDSEPGSPDFRGGTGCASGSYWEFSGGSGTTTINQIVDLSECGFDNMRYVKYQVRLCKESGCGVSLSTATYPRVSDIMINHSP